MTHADGFQAFEHILTDQQASLVKELESQVLKCVKDQNGNHVIQKAIQRIPAENISFIINAFTNQVQHLATHPYGCRVVQRMLEHCQDPVKTNILEELHLCAEHLIVDQYGNYVTQHVIVHGRPEDRLKIISIITSQLVMYSRHKFASNVVEKSIEHGSDEQRRRIVEIISTVDERGIGPMHELIKDQYGNYVIRKHQVSVATEFTTNTRQKNSSSSFKAPNMKLSYPASSRRSHASSSLATQSRSDRSSVWSLSVLRPP